jgi:hypothetical protein
MKLHVRYLQETTGARSGHNRLMTNSLEVDFIGQTDFNVGGYPVASDLVAEVTK